MSHRGLARSSKGKRGTGDLPEGKAKPKRAARALPAWLLPIAVLLAAFAVVVLALIARQSPVR